MGKTVKSFSFDAKKDARAKSKQKFQASKNAERNFARQLKKVARAAASIIDSHADGARLINEKAMIKALTAYSEAITPWAVRQSEKLLQSVAKSNQRAYKDKSKAMGAALRSGVAEQDVGGVAGRLLLEQVALIKSIPLEAGERAQKIAYENFLQGRRAEPDQSVIDELQKEMGMTEQVAVNRAKLIARTETARANASFVQARAAAVGVTHYIWRTTMDGAERKSHAKMNGKTIAYADPPSLSDGTVGHAGTFPNCRCWQDPILPDE